MKTPKNIPASVRQRLLNRAKNDKRPFNEFLQYYAMERFLFRLSQSAHADYFILKGALMLRVWRSPEIPANHGYRYDGKNHQRGSRHCRGPAWSVILKE